MQAAAEALLEHEWDATRFKPVRSSFCKSLVRSYSSSSDSLSVVKVTRSDLLAIWGLRNNPEVFLQMTHSHQSDEMNCCSLDMFFFVHCFVCVTDYRIMVKSTYNAPDQSIKRRAFNLIEES